MVLGKIFLALFESWYFAMKLHGKVVVVVVTLLQIFVVVVVVYIYTLEIVARILSNGSSAENLKLFEVKQLKLSNFVKRTKFFSWHFPFNSRHFPTPDFSFKFSAFYYTQIFLILRYITDKDERSFVFEFTPGSETQGKSPRDWRCRKKRFSCV